MSFVVVASIIWVCSAIGAAVTKDSDCFGYALVATVIVGFGYLILAVK